MEPALVAENPPKFPRAAALIGLVAVLLVAFGSVGASWVVSQRLRTIGHTQYEVLSASENLQTASQRVDATLRLAIATGDARDIRAYQEASPELKIALDRLEKAIELPQNRATFRYLDRAEAQIAATNEELIALTMSKRAGEAQMLLDMPQQRRTREEFRSRLEEIQSRSRTYVAKRRAEADRYLTLNIASSFLAILLLILAWFIVVRPARQWARELARMQREAAALAQAKSDFLAVMSHEIRTPLNGVIGFAELMLQDGGLSDEQRHRVEIIQSAGGMLLSIVNDVLDFSKIEAGKMDLSPEDFPLESLVGNCLSVVRPGADIAGLDLECNIDPALHAYYRGDSGRLRQILLNLLNNAVKFTRQGKIALCVGPVDGDPLRLRFSVTDTGVGIAPDRIEMLFSPFTQADASVARKYGGTGLGLSISRRLAEMMDGTLSVTSQKGRGSTFVLELPLQAGEEPEQLRPAKVSQQRARILLAEDVPMNQDLATTMLANLGHEVVVVGDGKAALDRAARESFDLILMDIQMPLMDGMSAARAIRALPGPQGAVKILALTANSLPEQLAQYRRAGMDGHVSKPIRHADLEIALATVLGNAGKAGSGEGAPPEAVMFDRAVFESVRVLLPADRLAKHLADLAALAQEVIVASGEAQRTLAHKLGSQAGALGLERLHAVARAVEDGTEEAGKLAIAAGDIDVARRHLLGPQSSRRVARYS